MLIDDTLRLLSPPSSLHPVGSNPVAAPRVGFAADCGGGEARLLGAYAGGAPPICEGATDRRL